MFIDRHRASWQRLEQLVKRSGKLSGPEADELIELYQRVTTHLSTVRSQTPDPATVERLSSLVAQARSVLTGTHTPAWRVVTRFFTHRLPAAIYLGWRWWVPAGVVFYLVSGIMAAWIATNPDVPASGLSLYRFSAGHGGLQCSACHGSTHAELPSSHANDNLQSVALQGHAGALAECGACHGSAPATVAGG